MKTDRKKPANGKPTRRVRRVKGNGAPPRGRPISYDPVHCARIVAHAKAGAAVADYADAIGVPPSALIEWARVHPEFLKALEIALAALAVAAAHQIDDVRVALIRRWDCHQTRLFATTDAAEADQLVRSLSDLGPKTWPLHAESLLAWLATPEHAESILAWLARQRT